MVCEQFIKHCHCTASQWMASPCITFSKASEIERLRASKEHFGARGTSIDQAMALPADGGRDTLQSALLSGSMRWVASLADARGLAPGHRARSMCSGFQSQSLDAALAQHYNRDSAQRAGIGRASSHSVIRRDGPRLRRTGLAAGASLCVCLFVVRFLAKKRAKSSACCEPHREHIGRLRRSGSMSRCHHSGTRGGRSLLAGSCRSEGFPDQDPESR